MGEAIITVEVSADACCFGFAAVVGREKTGRSRDLAVARGLRMVLRSRGQEGSIPDFKQRGIEIRP
jgi:hypothetical protein